MNPSSLYRVSLKCLVVNDNSEVLTVKEMNRNAWDLPGGGMEHTEDIRTAVARELLEEVAYAGDFTYEVLDLDEPMLIVNDIWQIRVILKIIPSSLRFSAGEEADEVQFTSPLSFKDSEHETERKIYEYAKKFLHLSHL